MRTHYRLTEEDVLTIVGCLDYSVLKLKEMTANNELCMKRPNVSRELKSCMSALIKDNAREIELINKVRADLLPEGSFGGVTGEK